MASKDRQTHDRKTHSPELEPYAPRLHPDVHVPEQQFEENRKKTDKEHRARPR